MQRILAGAFLLLLTSGPAYAWGVQGSIEPDHPLDTHRTTPNTTGSKVVYFNAVLTLPATATNPNAPYLGGRIHADEIESAVAYFGRWTDCNNDGYIGSAVTGTTTYPSALLVEPSFCEGVNLANLADDSDYPHNDRTLVRELIPTGWVANRAPIPGERLIDIDDDVTARIWGDRGLPNAPKLDCDLRPTAGTFANTGRMLQHADCRTPSLLDPPSQPPCGQEPAYARPNVFYDDRGCEDGPGLLEPSAEPAFWSWDCSGTIVGPVPRTESNLAIRRGSVYAGASRALSPFADDCGERTRALDEPYAALLPESRNDGKKRTTTFTFEFVDERGAHAPQVSVSDLAGVFLAPAAAPATREIGPIWVGTRTSVERVPYLRSDMGPGDPETYTFYAYTGQMTSDTLYQAGPCAAGVDCYRPNWWNPAYTDATMPIARRSGIAYGVAPGQQYNFSDIDCVDGQVVRGINARVGPYVSPDNACPVRSAPGDGGLLR